MHLKYPTAKQTLVHTTLPHFYIIQKEKIHIQWRAVLLEKFQAAKEKTSALCGIQERSLRCS